DSAGAITGVTFFSRGSYSVEPSNPVSVTGGTGMNATFTLIVGTDLASFIASLSPNITDAQDPLYPSGKAPRGIAVTGVDNSNGTWQYSTDSGATWINFFDPAFP